MTHRHSSQAVRFLAISAAAAFLLSAAPAQQQSTQQSGQQSQQQSDQQGGTQVIPQRSTLPPVPPAPRAGVPKAIGPNKIGINVDLVQINAVVTDKDGKLIKGLKPENFEMLEEGKVQKLEAVDYYDTEKIETADNAGAEPIIIDLETANDPEKIRPIVRDHRLIVLFFDTTSLNPEDLIRSTGAANNFIKKQMAPPDLVSVIMFGTTFKVLANFTNDRGVLQKAVSSLVPGKEALLVGLGTTATDAVSQDDQSAATLDDTEFNIFNTDSKLYAVRALCELLAGIPGKKSVLEFTSGVTQTGEENRSSLQAATDAANKANVSLYEADARGLVTDALDASTGISKGTAAFNGQTILATVNARHASRDTLYTLAADTGGRLFSDLNDFSGMFKQVQDDNIGYYLLSYYSSNTARDGRYRQVKVKLVGVPPGAHVKARQGYYAPKEFGIFNTEDREKQLDSAMGSDAVMVELPVAVDTAQFRFPDGQFFVPVSAKIASSALQWAKKSGRHEAKFDFLYEFRDVKSKKIAGTQRDTMTVQLDAVNFEQLSQKSLVYQGGIMLGPGNYRMKFLVRDNSSGHIGTFEQNVTIYPPRLNQLQLSTVMLSSQLVADTARVRGQGARQGGQGQQIRRSTAGNSARIRTSPLDVNGQRIVPSVTRVFTSQQTLYVLFQAYAPAKTDPAALRAGLVFFRNGQRANDTALVEAADINPVTHAASFRISLPLDKLATGNYTVQAVVVETGGTQAAFARNYFNLRKAAAPAAPPAAAPASPSGPSNPYIH
jgi:VWFA-related protein